MGERQLGVEVEQLDLKLNRTISAKFFLYCQSCFSCISDFIFYLSNQNLQNQPERAVRVFAKMRKIKILPDTRTYELLFSLFGTVNSPYEDSNLLSQVDVAKRINAIERDMTNNGVQHSQLSLKNLVSSANNDVYLFILRVWSFLIINN